MLAGGITASGGSSGSSSGTAGEAGATGAAGGGAAGTFLLCILSNAEIKHARKFPAQFILISPRT